jgi:hypothetical protein
MIGTISAAALAVAMMTGAAQASDAGVLSCRKTEDAKMAAGLCGAHGCDCGLLRSECAATRKHLRSFDANGRGSMAYFREKYAYNQDCKSKR